jgi:hypothetical protein
VTLCSTAYRFCTGTAGLYGCKHTLTAAKSWFVGAGVAAGSDAQAAPAAAARSYQGQFFTELATALNSALAQLQPSPDAAVSSAAAPVLTALPQLLLGFAAAMKRYRRTLAAGGLLVQMPHACRWVLQLLGSAPP